MASHFPSMFSQPVYLKLEQHLTLGRNAMCQAGEKLSMVSFRTIFTWLQDGSFPVWNDPRYQNQCCAVLLFINSAKTVSKR